MQKKNWHGNNKVNKVLIFLAIRVGKNAAIKVDTNEAIRVDENAAILAHPDTSEINTLNFSIR